MQPTRALAAWLCCAALLGATPQPAVAVDAPPATPQLQRPRIGLVLSGGGARGLAHVGVLKVLEQMQVPIDVIAGTSMGAIVGGLYAGGMRADAMERELVAIQWADVFSPRIERRHLSQRRKEEDFEISPLIELGLREGELRTPQGAVSSRGLESLLRRYTLPVRGIQSFDALPIPFRAVSTDMETGRAVVMDGGDLALALRSSMSVPGVFAPIEIDGHILGDGGLVNNTPVDVARALGAEIVIVSNIGTPLAGRASLGSVIGLTEQMINILTEQNVQRSLATLTARDVLIAPELGPLSSADFAQVAQLIALGAAGARGRSDRLAALSLPAAEYARWQQAHRVPPAGEPQIRFVRIEGSTATNPERLKPMLESRPGQTFNAERAEADARRLAGGGDYTRADYQLVNDAVQGDGLVFELEDKAWGPNYLRIGLDLSTDFRGRSAFNLKLSHNRHWLTASGTEWRNRLQIGEVPLLFSELYHPLSWSTSRADDWFVSAHAGTERRRLGRYDTDSGDELASYRRDTLVAGIDLGQPWGEFGELRFGLSQLRLRTVPELVRVDYQGPTDDLRWRETGARARMVIDQLDYPSFPQQGYRLEAELWHGRRQGALGGPLTRLEAQGLLARSSGADSFNLFALLLMADQPPGLNISRYQLGGFHQLSGYQSGQLAGNQVLLLRTTWYRRLKDTPSLTRGFFVGASLEVGNAWDRSADIQLSKLRSGMSLFLGADTGMGPLYLGITYAPKGSTGLVLFIGRP